MTHRWSGWPGAWCLDCGADDPFERALADGVLVETGEGFDIPEALREQYTLGPCPEPGSKRHDPYARRLAEGVSEND